MPSDNDFEARREKAIILIKTLAGAYNHSRAQEMLDAFDVMVRARFGEENCSTLLYATMMFAAVQIADMPKAEQEIGCVAFSILMARMVRELEADKGNP